ncbi:E3 ubiquitin-protein ligase Midline-1-like [Mytilus trossulus]|uniref:E3 ubiquitin-protein ligase Midline-1-like n=1 Tax=Mytilus trossulus TaxID=6551 RepID=UPI0030041F9A
MAQNLAVCEFCDLYTETTTWKCINCDLTLCENCKTKRHSKIRGSEEHSVIMLKQMGTLEAKDSVRKLELASNICSVHNNEKCTAYCKSCSKELCTFCAFEGKHQGHKILKLAISSQEGTKNYNKAKQDIIQREKDIIEFAHREAEFLNQELDTLLKTQNDTSNKTKKTLQTKIEYLNRTVNLTAQIIQSNDAKSILDTSFSIKKELPSKDIEGLNLSAKSTVEFIAPVVSLRFGSFVMTKLAIIKSVQTPLKTIECLESIDNVSASGLIYVTDQSTSSIHVLTLDGDFVANYGQEHGIVDPEVLHINKEGQLMIWCKGGTIHVADIFS